MGVLKHVIFVAKFRMDVRMIIHTIMERLEDSFSDVRKTAIELLSLLGVQGVCYRHFSVGVLKLACS